MITLGLLLLFGYLAYRVAICSLAIVIKLSLIILGFIALSRFIRMVIWF